jgi:hypothetical protein
MPPPSIPTVTAFTLARASDVNDISAALQLFTTYHVDLLAQLPVTVSVNMVTGNGGIPDLASTPANNVTVPLVFGFTGTLTTGDVVWVDTVSGVGRPTVGVTVIAAKVLNGATGNIGFFDAATLSVPQVVNFNVELNVPVHSVLQNVPPDAWRRQAVVGVGSNQQVEDRLSILEASSAVTASFPVAAVTSQAVIHNLGFRPIVQVIDGSGFMVLPSNIQHNSVNQFTVTFSTPFTGTILYR